MRDGRDIHGITAPIVAEAVARLTAACPTGALAPSELLDPEELLRALRPHALTLTIGDDALQGFRGRRSRRAYA